MATKAAPLLAHFAANAEHQQLGTSSAAHAPSFRTPHPGVEDDFARFTAAPAGPGPSTFVHSQLQPAPSAFQQLPSSVHGNDGEELMALLSGSGLADAVHGNWEAELFEEQRGWRNEVGATVPVDPAVSDTKGKGRQDPDEELMSSLSSLDLASRAYLRTLVALPPDESIAAYLAHNQYTQDVYALPAPVRQLLEAAEQGQPGVTQAEGRKKALRRLEMVMDHLWGANVGEVPTTPTTFGASASRPSRVETAPEIEDYGSLAAQHFGYRRRPPVVDPLAESGGLVRGERAGRTDGFHE